MLPHKLVLGLLCVLVFNQQFVVAQKRKPPTGGRLAVVIDERLAALRATPQLNGKLVRRLSRGRLVAVRSSKTTADGVTFFLVNVSTRTHGWIQREAVASPSRRGDDERLLRLIEGCHGFDRISRTRIFLNHFSRSPLRPKVLLLLGESAEEIADKLSRDTARKLTVKGDAPEFTYFMNYTGLDRYNRLGVRFTFNPVTRRFHYEGAAWRELIRRYPRSNEAREARKYLDVLYSQLRMK